MRRLARQPGKGRMSRVRRDRVRRPPGRIRGARGATGRIGRSPDAGCSDGPRGTRQPTTTDRIATTAMIAKTMPIACASSSPSAPPADDGHDRAADAGAEGRPEGVHQLEGRGAESGLGGSGGLQHQQGEHRIGQPHSQPGDRPAHRGDQHRHVRHEHSGGDGDPGGDQPCARDDEGATHPDARRPILEPGPDHPRDRRCREGEAAKRHGAASELDDAERHERLGPKEGERDREHRDRHGGPARSETQAALGQERAQAPETEPAARDRQDHGGKRRADRERGQQHRRANVRGRRRRAPASDRSAAAPRCARPGRAPPASGRARSP